MRIYAVWAFAFVLSLVAYADWFKALLGLLLLTAFIAHPDMPTNVAGIQGLNPWNLLLANILLGWAFSRSRERFRWDIPRHVNVLLFLYATIVVVGFGRLMADRAHMENLSTGYIVGEYLINTVKWVVPGLLLFEACRTEDRMRRALFVCLAIYVILALFVIKWMPPRYALSPADLDVRSRRVILGGLGYSRVNMSTILAGASWAVLSTMPLFERRAHRAVLLLLFVVVAYGQALTAGRMGYVAWGLAGLVLCTLRWRRYLPLLVLIPVVLAILLPGVVGRVLDGFSAEDEWTGETSATNETRVTAGRSIAWPYVIDKIGESPVVGYGREAMVRTGLAEMLWDEHGEPFSHPHNAYLQLMLDNGIVGTIPILLFFLVVIFHAGRFFMRSEVPLERAVGGATLSFVLTLVFASMGSQSFYPREGSVGMWVAIGLLLRLVATRSEREREQARDDRHGHQQALVSGPLTGLAARPPTGQPGSPPAP